jgi:hypothetical protein
MLSYGIVVQEGGAGPSAVMLSTQVALAPSVPPSSYFALHLHRHFSINTRETELLYSYF